MKTINKITLTALLILVSLSGLVAQKKWKDYLVSGSSVFVSGMLDGTIEAISYHYENGFKARFPNANDQFWNPAVSWKNKYKNGDCTQGPKFAGSTTVLVATTDAYHMLRTAKRTLDGFTLVSYVNSSRERKMSRNKRIKTVIKDFLILTAIRSAGFHLTYSVIFKPQPLR